MNYNFTVHECWVESGAYNFSRVNVMLRIPGSLRNYIITKSYSTPVEEDSVYAITLTATNRSTRERSDGTTVTVTTSTTC